MSLSTIDNHSLLRSRWTQLLVPSTALLAICVSSAFCGVLVADDWFGIQIIDQDTQRGLALAKVKTTDNVEHWTDNQGWIAFLEPGMMEKDIYFYVESPGYEYPKDGFGYQGVNLRTTRVLALVSLLSESIKRREFVVLLATDFSAIANCSAFPLQINGLHGMRE